MKKINGQCDDLTTRQVSERLGVAARTVIKYLKAGRFPRAYQVNPRLWLIPESDLEGFKKPAIGRPRKERES